MPALEFLLQALHEEDAVIYALSPVALHKTSQYQSWPADHFDPFDSAELQLDALTSQCCFCRIRDQKDNEE